MKRLLIAATMLLAVGSFATGCRSCQSCHDYDRPVADCACGACDTCGSGRAGSAFSGGYASEPMYEPTPYETVVE